jgi:hypothetical protein
LTTPCAQATVRAVKTTPTLRLALATTLALSAGCSSGGADGAGGAGGGSSSTTSPTSGAGPSSTTGTNGTSSSGTSSTGTGSTTTSSSTGTGGNTPGFGTIFTILLENHDYAEIVGSTNAPYINSLIAQYGLATDYMDSGTHPSLPNYLYLVSGDTQYIGIVDLDPTFFPFPKSADNLGHQMTAAGIKWRSYQEHAGGNCVLAANGNYAPKHDPFLYFDDIQNGPNGLCAETSVDYTKFAADLASGQYKYMWITPDLVSDGHNPTGDPVAALQASDAWLSTEVPKILASQAYQQNGVLFITWDEAEGRNGDSGDQVPMIVVSPKLKSAGYKSNTATSHASYLATVEEILGLPKLGAAANAPTLMEFFQLP